MTVLSDPGGHPLVTLLRCPECGTDLSGLATDKIFLCTSCGRCWVVGEEFRRMDIAFSNTDPSDSILFMPFWKVQADVRILNRLSREASSASVVEGPREFDGSDRMLRESSGSLSDVTYVFPAFATSLVLSTGVGLNRAALIETPVQSGSIPPLIGGSVGTEDTAPLARGVAIGMEVSRSDHLASVDLELTVHNTSILAIGCLPVKGYLAIAEGPSAKIPFAAITDWERISAWHGIK